MSDENSDRPELSRGEIETIHSMMMGVVSEALGQKVFKLVRSGFLSSGLFAVVMDVDDAAWCKHVNLGDNVAPQTYSINGSDRRIHYGVYERGYLRHFIDLLPSMAEYLSTPPPLGYIHVLVLGEGMASPFAEHWAIACTVDMEN